MYNKSFKAFTIVELMVVVVIVGILSVIGFVSYSNYTLEARDTNRIGQMTKTVEAFQNYAIRKKLPEPNNAINLVSGGLSYAKQGKLGSTVIETMELEASLMDPKDKLPYTYLLANNRKHFQFLALMEQAQNQSVFSITQSFARYEKRFPRPFGTELGILTQKDTNIPLEDLTITGSTLDISQVGSLQLRSYLSADEYVEGTAADFDELPALLEGRGKGWRAKNNRFVCEDTNNDGRCGANNGNIAGSGSFTLGTGEFISVWDTSLGGSATVGTIQLPLQNGGNYNFTVDWGDGTTNTITSYNQAETLHTYATGGIYTVKINGTIEGFSFNGFMAYAPKLIDISKWGGVKFANTGSQFFNATNFDSTATDVPDISNLTDMFRFFSYTKFNNPNIIHWNVSNVTNMANMFYHNLVFNQPIGNWNISSVTRLDSMFGFSHAFNQPLNNWNTSNVTLMNNMFSTALTFNQPLNNWNTSNVTNMSYMFYNAPAFDQNIAGWNVANVSLAGINNFVAFYLLTSGSWNDSERPVFFSATPFIARFQTDGANTIHFPMNSPNSERSYDVKINWGDGSPEVHHAIRQGNGAGPSINYTYSAPGIYTVTVTGYMQGFGYGSISSSNMYSGELREIIQWGSIRIMQGGYAFRSASNLNITATDTPYLAHVTSTRGMFQSATNLTGNFANWNTSTITDMANMFNGATNFNRPLSLWRTSSVTNMQNMFASATAFNQPLDFNTANVTTMAGMFNGATNFNQAINTWNTAKVTTMSTMFQNATNFNQNISCWDVPLILTIPSNFKTGSPLTAPNTPVWGTNGPC